MGDYPQWLLVVGIQRWNWDLMGDLVGDLRDHAELPGPTQSRKGADMVWVVAVTWKSAAMSSRCAQVL